MGTFVRYSLVIALSFAVVGSSGFTTYIISGLLAGAEPFLRGVVSFFSWIACFYLCCYLFWKTVTFISR